MVKMTPPTSFGIVMRSSQKLVLFFAVMWVGCSQSKHEQANMAAPESSDWRPAPAAAIAEASKPLSLQQYVITRSVGADSVQIIESTCIVAFPPTIAEAAEAQQEGTGDDFEVAADDYTFYFSDVIERAEAARIPIVDVSKRFVLFRISGSVSLLVDARAAGFGTWNPMLFRKGGPPVVYQLVGNPDTSMIRNFFGR
jgi:hypothetical protein